MVIVLGDDPDLENAGVYQARQNKIDDPVPSPEGNGSK
ncbi:hypothetical protein SDC9_176476 [bioreactor metagenome]|uniref:Uncharacterized protein n=1 Tax=bioreactor metagenome TaxID=1076179 RepID=A0A645GQ46_9ZZZZ